MHPTSDQKFNPSVHMCFFHRKHQTLNLFLRLGLLQDCVANCAALKIKEEFEERRVLGKDLQEINCVKSRVWCSCAHSRRAASYFKKEIRKLVLSILLVVCKYIISL